MENIRLQKPIKVNGNYIYQPKLYKELIAIKENLDKAIQSLIHPPMPKETKELFKKSFAKITSNKIKK